MNEIGKRRHRRQRRPLALFGLGAIVLLIAVVGTMVWLRLSPVELFDRLTRTERQTTVASGLTIDEGFTAWSSTTCGTQTISVPLLLENRHESGIPVIGSLIEAARDAVSMDSGAFMVEGTYDIVVPFDDSNGFRFSIDHEARTARVYITDFVVSRPDGDLHVLKRAQGLATMLSTEDPLIAQANDEADQLVASEAAKHGDWFVDCEAQLVKQWQALGGFFNYQTSVFVTQPQWPLPVRLADQTEPQQLEDVIASLDP